MAAPPCSGCGDTRWVRYFAETIDGDFEEAFRLCSCNYVLEGYDEQPREGLEHVGIALTGRLHLTARGVTLVISVVPTAATSR